jgi:hypothetical protein
MHAAGNEAHMQQDENRERKIIAIIINFCNENS